LKYKLVADIALERFKIAPGGTQMTSHAGPDFNPAQFPLIPGTIPVDITVVDLRDKTVSLVVEFVFFNHWLDI